MCRCGGIGRRKGLKIPRSSPIVPVRPRPAAPDKTKKRGFANSAIPRFFILLKLHRQTTCRFISERHSSRNNAFGFFFVQISHTICFYAITTERDKLIKDIIPLVGQIAKVMHRAGYYLNLFSVKQKFIVFYFKLHILCLHHCLFALASITDKNIGNTGKHPPLKRHFLFSE